MIILSSSLLVLGFISGLTVRGRVAAGMTWLLGLIFAPLAAWAAVELVGAAVHALSTTYPGLLPARPAWAILVGSGMPLVGLWAGQTLRGRRSRLRIMATSAMSTAHIVREIDRLVALPGVRDHEWLSSRWAKMSGQEKNEWAGRRMHSLRTLHRESGGLGLVRLGRRAADRLADLDRIRR